MKYENPFPFQSSPPSTGQGANVKCLRKHTKNTGRERPCRNRTICRCRGERSPVSHARMLSPSHKACCQGPSEEAVQDVTWDLFATHSHFHPRLNRGISRPHAVGARRWVRPKQIISPKLIHLSANNCIFIKDGTAKIHDYIHSQQFWMHHWDTLRKTQDECPWPVEKTNVPSSFLHSRPNRLCLAQG